MPLELFADNFSATVSSGGTGAPAAGTSETWTLNVVSGVIPPASNSATPASAFRVWDPAVPGEWMLVTNVAFVSGVQWTATVTRGIEGTPAAHTTGFTVWQVTTSGWLNGQDSRHGAVNVKTVYGVKGDGKTVTDGAMTSGSATLTSATAGFTAADVGKVISVASATSTAMDLYCKIASVTNATTAVLSVPARVTASGLTMVLDGIRTVADASVTADSTTVTSATMAFAATDAGSAVNITTAGRVALHTTISGFTNSTTVTLAATATRTCTASSVTYGTDDTNAIIAAFTGAAASPGSLYFPSGMYLAKPSNLGVNAMNIPANTRITGDGWDSIIRSTGAEDPATLSRELWGINTGTGGTPDPSTNISNVLIENLQFQGTVVEDGFLENGSNLLSLNACSDVIIRACKFTGSRSDGIYLGSSTQTNTERHNERIRIEDCTFDGLVNNNRNGISIIDGTAVTISHCAFMNLTRTSMPGAIDAEPNDYNFVRIRAIRIEGCYFTEIGGNQACVSMFLNTPQAGYLSPFQGWTFTGNVIYNLLSSTTGVLILQPNYPDDTGIRHDVLVESNIFRGDTGTNTGLAYCMELEGIRGAVIRDNIFDVSQQSLILGNNYKCLDIDITGNTFKDVGGSGGKAIELCKADRVRIEGNTFDHVSPVSGGGYIMRFVNGSALSTPSGLTVTPSNTGGTLTAAHGAYGYRVSAFMDNGNNTVPCAEVTGTIASGTTGSCALSWTPVYGAKGYNVFGRTVAGELLMTPAGQTATTFTDTGSVTPSGALPAAQSDRGGTNGVIFANNTIRQGSSNNTGNIANLVANHTTVTSALEYYGNRVPNNANLAIAPFTDDRWADNYGPAQHNLLAWTFDPNLCDGANGAQLLVSGTLYLTKLHLSRAALVTNILMYVSTIGATLTAGQSFACLYDAAGVLLGTTASQSSAWVSTGLKTMALTSTISVNAGDYYVGAWSVGTTPPVFAGFGGLFGAVGADIAAANTGLATPNLRACTSSTGRTTTAPNPFGAQTAIGKVIWAALS